MVCEVLIVFWALILHGLAQPNAPKCIPQSTESSCDNFGGSWTGMFPGNPLFDEYSITDAPAPLPFGHFSCVMIYTPAKITWANCSGQLSPDNSTATVTFNTGLKQSGTVSPNCQSIMWSDGSTWQRFVRDAGPLNIHFSLHTHDDVGWNKNLQNYFDGGGPYEYGQNVTAILGSVVQGEIAWALRVSRWHAFLPTSLSPPSSALPSQPSSLTRNAAFRTLSKSTSRCGGPCRRQICRRRFGASSHPGSSSFSTAAGPCTTKPRRRT